MEEIETKTRKVSVRIPEDLAAYVELQEGDDFTKKLIGILREYASGEEDRKLQLKSYDECIKQREGQLERLSVDIWEAGAILQNVSKALRQANAYLEQHKT